MDKEDLVRFVESDEFQKPVRDAYRDSWAHTEAWAVAQAIAEAFKQIANKAGY